MKKQKIVALIFLMLTGVLAIVSIIVLPDTVITQFSPGTSNVSTQPKWLAILLPTAIGAGFSLMSLGSNAEGTSNYKCLFASGVGVAVFVIMLFVNL